MLVHAEHGRVTAVGKHLCGDTATDRSLGVVVSGGGTAYADLAIQLRHARYTDGYQTVWFYQRLTAACAKHRQTPTART